MTWTGTVPSFSVIEDLLAADLQTMSDVLTALTDPWTTYPVTWTGGSPNIGNGTLTGVYLQVGHLVIYRIHLVAGSTTTFGTVAYTFSLPVPSNQATGSPLGIALLNDSSVTTNRAGGWSAWQNGASSIALGDSAAGRVSPTNPYTMANGDQIAILGAFEAA